MSQVVEFLKKVSNDKVLSEEVKKAISKASNKNDEVKAVVAVAKKAGFAVDEKQLAQTVFGFLKKSTKLSDDDLDKVAGGRGGGSVTVSVVVPDVVDIVGGTVSDIAGTTKDVANTTVKIAEDAGKQVVETITSIFSGW